MDEDKRLKEIKKMREAMEVINEVVNDGDVRLATEMEKHFNEFQEELKELTWGRCQDKNCTLKEWVR